MKTRGRTLLNQAVTAACAALLAGGALWAAGFAAFNGDVRHPASPPPASDGIVALTGGADRVATAMRLLAGGQAPLLLVSGVGGGAELAGLMRHAAAGPDGGEPLETETMERVTVGRVTLGRDAASTAGNAQETAGWAQAHGMRSLIVVTAGYHMPRALLELRRALPGVVLHPAPVRPPALRGGLDPGTLRVLATEYDKLLAVRLELGLEQGLGLKRRISAVWGS